MKIVVRQVRMDSVLAVVVATSDWDRLELDAIVRDGEPDIETGGVFRLATPDCACGGDAVPGPSTKSGYRERMKWFLDELDKVCREGTDTGRGLQKAFLDLRDAAAWEASFDSDDMAANPSCYFELPSRRRKVRSEFPVMAEFGEEDFDFPEECAKAWSGEIVKRIATTVRMLRSTSEPVVRREVYEI